MDKNATLRSFFTQSSTKQSQNDNILSIKLRYTLFGLPDNCRNKVFLYHCVKSVFPLISTFATRGLPKAFQHKYPNNTSSKSLIPDTKTQLELELNILTPSKEMYYGFCYLIMWLLFPCKLRCADSIRGKSEGAWLIVFVSLTLWLLTLVLTRNSFSFPWSHSLTDIFSLFAVTAGLTQFRSYHSPNAKAGLGRGIMFLSCQNRNISVWRWKWKQKGLQENYTCRSSKMPCVSLTLFSGSS